MTSLRLRRQILPPFKKFVQRQIHHVLQLQPLANRANTSWIIVAFDTDGEVIFAEASQVANQLVERAPSVGSGLFQTSPSVSKLAKSLKPFKSV